MNTYIAHFQAKHALIQIEQNAIFTWKQESGEIDTSLLQDKIKRESAKHFFQLVAGDTQAIALGDISVRIIKATVFSG
ncbi:MAG: GTP-binding protein LepA [Maribacter sp.]|nr:GTP-binding protein LepA [Maribacter sp.]